MALYSNRAALQKFAYGRLEYVNSEPMSDAQLSKFVQAFPPVGCIRDGHPIFGRASVYKVRDRLVVIHEKKMVYLQTGVVIRAINGSLFTS